MYTYMYVCTSICMYMCVCIYIYTCEHFTRAGRVRDSVRDNRYAVKAP